NLIPETSKAFEHKAFLVCSSCVQGQARQCPPKPLCEFLGSSGELLGSDAVRNYSLRTLHLTDLVTNLAPKFVQRKAMSYPCASKANLPFLLRHASQRRGVP